MKSTSSTQHSKRRQYYIKRGNWSNVYALRWTDSAEGDKAAIRLGYDRITRAEAIQQARAERERQKYDPSFAGHADSRVYPLYTIDRHGSPEDISTAAAAPGPGIIAERA